MERRVEADVPEPQRADDRRAATSAGSGSRREPRGRTIATTASSEHDDPAGVERERRAEMPVHRGDDGAGHAAERARDAGERAQRARDRRVHRERAATRPRSRPCPPLASAQLARAQRRPAIRRAVTPAPAWPRRCLRARTRDACRTARPRPSARPAPRARREVRAHRDRQREPAVEELVDRREVGRVERGHVPGRDRLDRHRRRRARRRARGRGSGRARRSCPPRDRRGVGRARSRRSRSTPTR